MLLCLRRHRRCRRRLLSFQQCVPPKIKRSNRVIQYTRIAKRARFEYVTLVVRAQQRERPTRRHAAKRVCVFVFISNASRAACVLKRNPREIRASDNVDNAQQQRSNSSASSQHITRATCVRLRTSVCLLESAEKSASSCAARSVGDLYAS